MGRRSNYVVFSSAKVKRKRPSRKKLRVKSEEKLFNIYFSYLTAEVGLKLRRRLSKKDESLGPCAMSLTLGLHNFDVFVFGDKDFSPRKTRSFRLPRGCCVIFSWKKEIAIKSGPSPIHCFKRMRIIENYWLHFVDFLNLRTRSVLVALLSFIFTDHMKKKTLNLDVIFINIYIDRCCWPLNGLLRLPYVNHTGTLHAKKY